MSTRLRLRRADGRIYLDRWGWEPSKRIGGIFLHRMQGPDPGEDLHDHPWWFGSFILAGSYTEHRSAGRAALFTLEPAEERRRWSWRTMRLDECHRIVSTKGTVWTLVVHGPTRRGWGFYLPSGWLPWRAYELSDAGRRRELAVDITNVPDEQARCRPSVVR